MAVIEKDTQFVPNSLINFVDGYHETNYCHAKVFPLHYVYIYIYISFSCFTTVLFHGELNLK